MVGTRSPWQADWEVILGFKPETGDLLATQRNGATEDEPTAIEKTPRACMWLLRGLETADVIRGALASSAASFLLDKINALRTKRALDPLLMDANQLLTGALVQVKLSICGRGAPDDSDAIYLIQRGI